MAISREAAAWGMRMLIGVEPPNDEVIDFHRNGYDTLEELRLSFMRTPEAKALFASANEGVAKSYMIPPFLLRRPSFPEVPWRFEEPSLENPVSQLCTSEQMSTPLYRDLCRRLMLDPASQQRKVWEFAYILSVLEHKSKLGPGMKGVGFGTGHEPLPSVFAAMGAQVLATDAPADLNFSEAWAESSQWTNGLEELWLPQIVSQEEFFDKVKFQPLDMNNIPPEVEGYDFCWSACCLEHLGSIRHGLDFIRNSLNTLKPGGVAVHTTEFNLGSEVNTIEWANLCLFRKRDLELVIHEMTQDGHLVEPLNLWPGSMPVDEHIDLPPFTSVHLKLQLVNHTTTSVGIIVTKQS